MEKIEINLNDLMKSMSGGGIRDNFKQKSYSSERQQRNNNMPRETNKNINNKAANNFYVGAPYNFVEFTEKQYEYPEDLLPTHDCMKNELTSGEIEYEITAETPIFVDDGTVDHHFRKNENGKYCIPGSSVRGLIRNNVQILGFSSFEDDIDDYALMYRNVANGAEKDRYKDVLGSDQISIGINPKTKKNMVVSILKNVKAGYIRQEAGKYYIYHTSVDKINNKYEEMNYYIVSEKKIIKDYQIYKNQGKKDFQYDFFTQNNHLLQNTLESDFHKEIKHGKVHYIGIKNREYRPYYEPISYLMTGMKTITAVGNSEKYKRNGKQGFAISSGYMNEKKAVYIIPEINEEKERILIPTKDVEAFKVDIEKRKNTLNQFGGREFFDLPTDGKTKPVFYIELDGRLYFGFTPRLRLFYDHTVKDGLPENQRTGKLDFARAMFGYSNDQKSYKSRLSFSDAVVKKTVAESERSANVILSEPKPTSYMDYLEQSNRKGTVTYNSNEFRLRGVKQYWLHQSAGENVGLNNNKNITSEIHALPEKTVFVGKVRFKNLTKQELGLLLWAMRLERDSQMNIGKAKAYGYGRIALNIKSAKKINLQSAYECMEKLDLSPFEDIAVDDEIMAYKIYMAKNQNLKTIEDSPRIRDFLAMKDSKKIPNKDAIRYMCLGNEYAKRTQPLPKVGDVIKKIK